MRKRAVTHGGLVARGGRETNGRPSWRFLLTALDPPGLRRAASGGLRQPPAAAPAACAPLRREPVRTEHRNALLQRLKQVIRPPIASGVRSGEPPAASSASTQRPQSYVAASGRLRQRPPAAPFGSHVASGSLRRPAAASGRPLRGSGSRRNRQLADGLQNACRPCTSRKQALAPSAPTLFRHHMRPG